METSLTGSANFSYYYFNGRITNRRNWSHYTVLDTYVPDAIGNTRLVSGLQPPSTGVWDFYDYYPYGGEWVHPYMCCVGNHYKFTGKERDPESGDDNFGARFYTSNLGRFTSPDPGNIGALLDAPQSWNAYSYVLNNPLNAIDRNGLDCIYANRDGTANVIRGDCLSEKDNGYYVDGTMDVNSKFRLESTGNLSFGYTDENGAYGVHSISGFYDMPDPGDFLIGGVGYPPSGMGGGVTVDFTFGVRNQGESFNQCMNANSGNYSLNSVFGTDSMFLSNDLAELGWGNRAEATAGLAFWEGGSNSFGAAVPKPGTMGRRTSSVPSFNLNGKTGPGKQILGKTGAKQSANSLTVLRRRRPRLTEVCWAPKQLAVQCTDNFCLYGSMMKSVEDQINNGLRLGGGMGLFLIAAILFGDARTRLLFPAHGSSYWLGGFELLASTAIFILTAHIWWQYLAGAALFGVFKGLIAFVAGSDLFPIRHIVYSRTQAIGLIAYCLVSLVFLWRFSSLAKYMIADRIALTAWLFCLLPAATSLLSWWQIIGLVILGFSWVISRGWHSLQF